MNPIKSIVLLNVKDIFVNDLVLSRNGILIQGFLVNCLELSSNHRDTEFSISMAVTNIYRSWSIDIHLSVS